RGQMAAFLWRAAGKPEPAGKENPFADVTADDYYAKAVQWAYEQGITGGTSATTFSPDATCTRAQMAVFLYHMEQAKGGGFTGTWMFRLPFTDTPDWAYEAIAWCYKEGVVSGTSETTFSPDANCTRGQMVTFLYRYFAK
ncbi:MAG: S-layer homology domain-containing protein, partial [Bacillota bacterium]|nr:S-layer homology domain-containing protein [Bacillota bacterium]